MLGLALLKAGSSRPAGLVVGRLALTAVLAAVTAGQVDGDPHDRLVVEDLERVMGLDSPARYTVRYLKYPPLRSEHESYATVARLLEDDILLDDETVDSISASLAADQLVPFESNARVNYTRETQRQVWNNEHERFTLVRTREFALTVSSVNREFRLRSLPDASAAFTPELLFQPLPVTAEPAAWLGAFEASYRENPLGTTLTLAERSGDTLLIISFTPSRVPRAGALRTPEMESVCLIRTRPVTGDTDRLWPTDVYNVERSGSDLRLTVMSITDVEFGIAPHELCIPIEEVEGLALIDVRRGRHESRGTDPTGWGPEVLEHVRQ